MNFESSDVTFAKQGILMHMAKYRLKDMFQELDVKLSIQGKIYVGPCPVHGGRASDSLKFFPDGKQGKALWSCFSNHCEADFKSNIIGFVIGVLSHQKYGWERTGDEKVGWIDAIHWLCDFLEVEWDRLKVDTSLKDRENFIAGVEAFTQKIPYSSGSCHRDKLRKFLEIPSDYYMKRGYPATLLDKYDVGLCRNPKSRMYGRIVIPFYDYDSKGFVGAIGRSIHDECPQCKMHHPIDGPCFTRGSKTTDYCKVLSSESFAPQNLLYNYWYAEKDIYDTRCIVIVEGAADVWRLVEAGITNCVAINGCTISEPQIIAIECSGATEIYCLTDNDASGQRAYEQIAKRCRFANKVHRPAYDGKDVGALSVHDLKNYDFSKALIDRLK